MQRRTISESAFQVTCLWTSSLSLGICHGYPEGKGAQRK